jgi:hypothetical protein
MGEPAVSRPDSRMAVSFSKLGADANTMDDGRDVSPMAPSDWEMMAL